MISKRGATLADRANRAWTDNSSTATSSERCTARANTVKRLSEVPEHVDFLFLDEAPHDDQAWDKTMKGEAAACSTP